MATKNIAYIINETATEVVDCEIVNNNDEFVIAQGILQEAEKLNRNRRFYSTDDLYNEVYGKRVRELVTSGNFKGEAGHPLDMNLIRQQKIDPTLEQVWFTKLWMDGPLVEATFRGTNNELGKSFNQDLKDGQKPSFSLRSLGRMVTDNGRVRVTGLRMVCYDRVYFPSYDNAYTDHIVSESASLENKSSMTPELQAYIENKGNRIYTPVQEDAIAPITNKDILNILIKESYDFNSICEQYDPYFKSITLTDDKSAVRLVDESYNVIVMPLNSYIKNKINDFCNKY